MKIRCNIKSSAQLVAFMSLPFAIAAVPVQAQAQKPMKTYYFSTVSSRNSERIDGTSWETAYPELSDASEIPDTVKQNERINYVLDEAGYYRPFKTPLPLDGLGGRVSLAQSDQAKRSGAAPVVSIAGNNFSIGSGITIANTKNLKANWTIGSSDPKGGFIFIDHCRTGITVSAPVRNVSINQVILSNNGSGLTTVAPTQIYGTWFYANQYGVNASSSNNLSNSLKLNYCLVEDPSNGQDPASQTPHYGIFASDNANVTVENSIIGPGTHYGVLVGSNSKVSLSESFLNDSLVSNVQGGPGSQATYSNVVSYLTTLAPTPFSGDVSHFHVWGFKKLSFVRTLLYGGDVPPSQRDFFSNPVNMINSNFSCNVAAGLQLGKVIARPAINAKDTILAIPPNKATGGALSAKNYAEVPNNTPWNIQEAFDVTAAGQLLEAHAGVRTQSATSIKSWKNRFLKSCGLIN